MKFLNWIIWHFIKHCEYKYKPHERFDTHYNGFFPKFITTSVKQKGLNRGLDVLWRGKGIILIRPINERYLLKEASK